ncbi:hypothetical protein MKW94_022750 [Papaver nudicaule]|uniref:Protein TIFY n=1 Tax=Papaver nudicaule TaxID=74823 RepID=A0AA41VTA0_PAPNU|nr:hypothetical protein [Papaver nudicaule]
MKPAETTILRSALDKPLQQLTEDDISQLTREDCRRYLIEKGMRRPSWNKSQAIEQVICLKSLLETTFDDACNNNNRTPPVRPSSSIPVQTQVPSPTTTSTDFQVSSPNKDDSVSHRRKDPSPNPGITGDLSCRSPVSGNNLPLPPPPSRNLSAANELASQMTIFYSGKVNVYDGVSVDKARVIMQFAASPFHLLENDSSAGTTVVPPCRIQAAFTRPASAETSWQYGEEGTVSRDGEPEGRQASLQRYLEKRKDRGRFKIKKKVGGSSTSLEVYGNPQMKFQNPNEQSSPSGTCSPPRDGHM